jgi:hypothetical protein
MSRRRAWRTSPSKGGGYNLTEVQGHMIVGLLLGYPEMDVKAMHTVNLSPSLIELNSKFCSRVT